MFSFEGFSCSFCVFYGGLGISKLPVFIKKIYIKKCPAIFLGVMKTLDLELDPDQYLDLDPDLH
jgi:hypothetical protein